MKNKRLISCFSTALISLLIGANALALTVTEIGPNTTSDNGIWFASDIRGAGTASIVDLTGAGGDLENNLPTPSAAVLLTTGFDNGDKAEIGVLDDFGLPQDIFATLNLSYSWFKTNNPGQNVFAAPSIKLTFYNPVCDDALSAGDCFGQLIYEPTWNGPGASEAVPQSSAPPMEQWVTTSINQSTGLFWWTGGFGKPNSYGGPPTLTLASWLASLSSDFGDATLISVSVGVGTYNQGQIVYFDDVRISHSHGAGLQSVTDFELPSGPLSAVPTLTTGSMLLMAVLSLLIGGIVIRRRAHL